MGYLLLEERTWCLIQPVGAGTERGRDKKNKTQKDKAVDYNVASGCIHDPGSSNSYFIDTHTYSTLTARFAWLSWVTGTAAKGGLEVMDGLLKNLPFSALTTANNGH